MHVEYSIFRQYADINLLGGNINTTQKHIILGSSKEVGIYIYIYIYIYADKMFAHV
jgi:hypothetical protein